MKNSKTFYFEPNTSNQSNQSNHNNPSPTSKKETILVPKNELYHKEKGYGFIRNENRKEDHLLQISELNNAFEASPFYTGELPFHFKCNVGSCGNYKITLKLTGNTTNTKGLLIFSGRRRLMMPPLRLEPSETRELTFTMNVCDIIPRGQTQVYEDHTLDITILGKDFNLICLIIEAITVPTIYIAGDSTVTDQSAQYPYQPGTSYNGWGQMLPMHFKPTIAISNHAHSGLTTESFRTEGHYDIIKQYIKAGDYFFMQFAHNDQKLPHLGAKEGYANNLKAYIKEMKELGVNPVIVTPLCRNSWNGNLGIYNDLLKEYAQICHEIGDTLEIPVLDLHKKSLEFILEKGLEKSKPYFYPKDYTHTNDYGGYLMAQMVALECSIKLPKLSDHLTPIRTPIIPAPITNSKQNCNPDPNYKSNHSKSIPPISNYNQPDYRPNDLITRAEALELVIKAVNFFPTNVYNDMFTDIIGHEWYAGIIECAYTNGLIDPRLIIDHHINPNQSVPLAEFISYCINGYHSRVSQPTITPNKLNTLPTNSWIKTYLEQANSIGLIDSDTPTSIPLTRKEAAILVNKLSSAL